MPQDPAQLRDELELARAHAVRRHHLRRPAPRRRCARRGVAACAPRGEAALRARCAAPRAAARAVHRHARGQRCSRAPRSTPSSGRTSPPATTGWGAPPEEHGVELVFHPHADTHVDTQERVERFLADTDPAFVNLCLDTGHISYCDGDNVAIVQRFPDRIRYVHLKQVDPAVHRRVRAEKLSLAEAVPLGVMVEPPYGVPGDAAAARRAGRARTRDAVHRRRAGPLPGRAARPPADRRPHRRLLRRLRPGPGTALALRSLQVGPRSPPTTRYDPGRTHPMRSAHREYRKVDRVLVQSQRCSSPRSPPAAVSGGAQDQAGARGRRGRGRHRRRAVTRSRWSPTSRRVTPSGTRSAPAPRPQRTSHGVTLQVLQQRERPRAGDPGAERHRLQGRRHRGDPVQRRRRHPGRPRRPSTPTIPVVAFNQGIDDYKDAGAMMYFGSDEDLAGQTVGSEDHRRRRRQDALRHPGAGLGRAGDPLCRVSKTTFPHTENLQVNGADLPSVQSTLAGEARPGPVDHPRRDPRRTDRAGRAAGPGAAGVETKVITFDLNSDAAAAIQDGDIEFSIDQQPYVQGYMAVDRLWLNLTNGNDIGGGQPVLHRPVHRRQDQHRADPAVHRRTTHADARPGGGRSGRPPPAPSHRREPMSTPVATSPSTDPDEPVQSQRSLASRLLTRPEIGAIAAAVAIFIFFFAIAPPFRSAARRSPRSSTPARRSASSPSGWRC